jgi:hypothetical protein
MLITNGSASGGIPAGLNIDLTSCEATVGEVFGIRQILFF